MDNIFAFLTSKGREEFTKKIDESYYKVEFFKDVEKFTEGLVLSNRDCFFIEPGFFNKEEEMQSFVEKLHNHFFQNRIFVVKQKEGDVKNSYEVLKSGATDILDLKIAKSKLFNIIENFGEDFVYNHESDFCGNVRAELGLIGASSGFTEYMSNMARIFRNKRPLVIVGEIGSEKFKTAHFYHNYGDFSKGRIVRKNTSELVEKKGMDKEIGALFKQALGGTLLLEEVNLFGKHLSRDLNKVIDYYYKHNLKLKVKLVLSFSVKKDKSDLALKRDDIDILRIPPLRQLKDDIPHLVKLRLEGLARDYGVKQENMTEAALAMLQSYDWPGNIFELNNLVDALFIKVANDGGKEITEKYIPDDLSGSNPVNLHPEVNFEVMSSDLKKARAIFEKQYISSQIKRFGGNISQTASFIGMERTALHRKLISLGIDSNYLRRTIRGEK